MTLSGIGIHSGVSCAVRLHRSDGPVRFLRRGVEIRAGLALVESTKRCTTLATGGERIAMVEHLLAALHVAGWWRGVLIEASAAELPILDGSAEPWLEPIEALGAPPPTPPALAPTRAVEVGQGTSRVRLEPGEPFVRCNIEFDHPSIGRQAWSGAPESYRELLPARTFGFLAEAPALICEGLAMGAGVENAIVFDDGGPMQPLRTPNEPVRHKALDLLGDLFLLERPLAGRVTATRGSHALHIELMRCLGTIPPVRSESLA